MNIAWVLALCIQVFLVLLCLGLSRVFRFYKMQVERAARQDLGANRSSNIVANRWGGRDAEEVGLKNACTIVGREQSFIFLFGCSANNCVWDRQYQENEALI